MFKKAHKCFKIGEYTDLNYETDLYFWKFNLVIDCYENTVTDCKNKKKMWW